MKILVIGILIYLIWAAVYHRKDKTLKPEIMIEYLLLAVLSLILLIGVIV